nr:hypothetical protein CFP56_31701 [Quercus suber]
MRIEHVDNHDDRSTSIILDRMHEQYREHDRLRGLSCWKLEYQFYNFSTMVTWSDAHCRRESLWHYRLATSPSLQAAVASVYHRYNGNTSSSSLMPVNVERVPDTPEFYLRSTPGISVINDSDSASPVGNMTLYYSTECLPVRDLQ